MRTLNKFAIRSDATMALKQRGEIEMKVLEDKVVLDFYFDDKKSGFVVRNVVL